MPLDRVNGERIDDRRHDPVAGVASGGELYAARYEVIEPRHLLGHDIRVEYELPTRFRSRTRRKTAHRHIGEDVAIMAGQRFLEMGAFVPIGGMRFNEDDFLIQVYPDLLKVAVLVQRQVACEEKLVTLVYPRDGVWPPQLIRTLLEAAGKRMPTLN